MNRIAITRYGNKYWAVWLDGELLAVTVYKKGATTVANAFIRLTLDHRKEVHHAILAA